MELRDPPLPNSTSGALYVMIPRNAIFQEKGFHLLNNAYLRKTSRFAEA
jgi:hypothetical protein